MRATVRGQRDAVEIERYNLATMSNPTASDDPQLAALERRIAELESVVVCFSGGVDSAFVLQVAARVLGDRAVGLTAVSASLAPSEKSGAEALAHALGARHVLVDTREIDNPSYAANGADRCYHCKSELYGVARRWAAEHGFRHVANGVNLDDLGDYRPGLQAASEAAIVSPLVDAGMRKEDVRVCHHACRTAPPSRANDSVKSAASKKICAPWAFGRFAFAGTTRSRALKSNPTSSHARSNRHFESASWPPAKRTAFST
jgi:NAD synthase